MELVNTVYAFKDGEQNPGVLREALEAVVRLLNPFVPHACEELWETLGHSGSVEAAGWPAWDDAALVADEITLVVQVNGKVRGKVAVAVDADKETAEAAALTESNVQRFVEGKQVRKIIVVPGRLINIVVS
jgi:leucyl-tRNA synthetase